MAVFKYLNANGQWETVDTAGAIKYTEQNLTEEQKAQARNNIGITETSIDSEALNEMIEEVLA